MRATTKTKRPILLAATSAALLIAIAQPTLLHAQPLEQELAQSEAPQDAAARAEPSQEELALGELPQGQAPLHELAQEPAERDAPQAQVSPAPVGQQDEVAKDAPPDVGGTQVEVAQPALPQGEPERAALPQTDVAQREVPQTGPEQSERDAQPADPIQDDSPLGEMPRDAGWTVFVQPSSGTRVDIPGGVFSMPDGPAYRGVGQQFKTPDGRAVLAVYSLGNPQRNTPLTYLRKNFKAPRTSIDYERVTRAFFAVSGVNQGTIYYSRCNFQRNGALHCFDVKYPEREKRAWDAIVTRMSRSLRPLDRS